MAVTMEMHGKLVVESAQDLQTDRSVTLDIETRPG